MAVSAHRNHYTYLYRRKPWRKPLVGDTDWAKRNGVRQLHYIERIDHFHDKSVKAHIHITQYIFDRFILIFFFT